MGEVPYMKEYTRMILKERTTLLNNNKFTALLWDGPVWSPYINGASLKPFGGDPDCDTQLEWIDDYGLAIAACINPSVLAGKERFWSTELGRTSFNDCDHWKTGIVILPLTALTLYYKNGTVDPRGLLYTRITEQAHNVILPTSTYTSKVDDFIVKHPPIDYRAAQTTAWHTMQPRFEGQLSLLNAIFELKDFRDIIKFLHKIPFGAIKKSIAKESRGMKDLNEISGGVAKAHLMNSFGIQPLIKDVVSGFMQLQQMVDAMQLQFQLDGETNNKRHYTEVFDITKTLASPYPYASTNSSYLQGTRLRTVFNATLDYTYQYTLRTLHNAVKQYWGLDMSSEALWNMLPWSFFVDYFFNIGKTLKIMRHDTNVDLAVRGYCESLLTTSDAGFYVNSAVNFGNCVLNGKLNKLPEPFFSGRQSSFYSRRRCDPNFGPVAPRFVKPTWAHGINVGALLRCVF